MTNNQKEWFEDMIANWPNKPATSNEIRDIIECTRSRLKEEAVKALEGEKTCTVESECVACEEAGKGTPDCVNEVVKVCIKAIKKL